MISRERRTWGSGNPGTRQPAGGLGIATAGGPNRARDQRTRGTHGGPAELPRIIRGLERDDERRRPCRETDRTEEQNKRLFKKRTKQNEVKGRRLLYRSGLLSRCTHEGGYRNFWHKVWSTLQLFVIKNRQFRQEETSDLHVKGLDHPKVEILSPFI